MARRFYVRCECCYDQLKLLAGQRVFEVCEHCLKQEQAMRRLHVEIIQRYPALSKVSRQEVFERLWKHFQKGKGT